MRVRFGAIFISASILGVILLHNNCTYRASDNSSQNSDSTIIGNPMTNSQVAKFTATRPQSSISICLSGYNLLQSGQSTTVIFDKALQREITQNGASLGEFSLPSNTYSAIEMILDNRCGSNFSLQVQNKSGSFKTSEVLKFSFSGEVILSTPNKKMTFNIQAIFDKLEEVTSDTDLLLQIGKIGMVSTQDLWASLSFNGAPAPRNSNASAWTGREMIIWGGYSTGVYHDDGAIYDPANDIWRSINPNGAPSARYVGSSVWTGTHMIVWGGIDFLGSFINTGGMYDPLMNQWFSLSTNGAPTGRTNHTAVWTGKKMIVWGGQDELGSKLNTGAAYDPSSDTWTPLSTLNAPTGRIYHSAVWTGSEMIIWGGCSENLFDCGGDNPGMNTGARYNPNTDTWTELSMINAPSPRYGHNVVWTGTKMLVWSGNRFQEPFGSFLTGDGGQYDPNSDTWSPVSHHVNVTPRVEGVAVWTGEKMLIWGGRDYNFKDINSSALYDPLTDTWQLINPQNAPAPRRFASGFWTGFEIIIWGGWQGGADYLNSGGRYRP